jgi:hypothetical protein
VDSDFHSLHSEFEDPVSFKTTSLIRGLTGSMNPNGMHGMDMTLDLDKGIVRIKAQDLATNPKLFYSIDIHKDGVICLTYSSGIGTALDYYPYDIRSASGHHFEGIIFLLLL